MASCLFLLICLSAFASAYSGTYPVVALSSEPSSILESLPASFENSYSPLHYIANDDDICSHNAVIIVEHPGVHASDLRSLAPSSSLARRFTDSFTRNYPYVPTDSYLDSASHLTPMASQCGFRTITFTPGAKVTFDLDYKHLVYLKMPLLSSSGGARRKLMNHHGEILSIELDNLASIFPDHIVIYTGIPSSSEITKRQESISHSPSRMAVAQGGILKRYQLLTPGLISALLIVLFILLPVVLFGTSALASIKSPLKGDYAKGYNAREKKVQ
ncbi:hypothetical protein M378DRAFT_159865 [Amanita muscaria Koide BX008]|uniref:Protein BIG1 n=1 Tax=Amanita muscaria (strain Koide BX008) TaxID=946122 RepID=A0A0C2X000_AMAMK|nr:hypothetical protein M378DRAFT_159865 [Amanita muscaria Koide BX008]